MGRRRRYFHVADQVAHEPWSNDQLAMLVRLMAHLHERWARDGIPAEQAGRCQLSMIDAERISGKHRADVAAKSLRCLADVVSMSVEHRGDVLVIDWPKFVNFQNLGARDGSLASPLPCAPHPHPHPEKDAEGGQLSDRQKPESWLAEAGRIWTAAYGGTFYFAKAAKFLKPVFDAVGGSEMERRLTNYCREMPARYASLLGFSEKHGAYANGAHRVRDEPSSRPQPPPVAEVFKRQEHT